MQVLRPVLCPVTGASVLRTFDRVAELGMVGVGVFCILRLALGDSVLDMGALWALLAGLLVVMAVSRLLERNLEYLVALRTRSVLARATKDVDRLEAFLAHAVAPAVAGVLAPAVAVACVGAFVSWPVAGGLAAGLVAVLALSRIGVVWHAIALVTALLTVVGMALLGTLTGLDTVLLAAAMAVGLRALDLTKGVERFFASMAAAADAAEQP